MISQCEAKCVNPQIYVSAIKNEIKTAEVQYLEALQYYNNRNSETFRLRQIIFATLIYASWCGLLLWLFGTKNFFPPVDYSDSIRCCDEALPTQDQRACLLPMMLASLAGSFYTIVKNVGKNDRDAEGARWLVICDCGRRSIIALMLGVLAWYLLCSDFTPRVFSDLRYPYFSFIIIAFAAGLTDTFIPSLIGKNMPADSRQ